MWLLQTTTLRLRKFLDDSIPAYAILSHTWYSEEEEVTLQEIQGPQRFIERRRGFIKIKQCCKQAMIDGFDYVWIDTCCIDKTNSVELSEAINSMFTWYGMAGVCYAYLDDVEYAPNSSVGYQPGPTSTVMTFMNSRWFTRGWTLQELLSPDLVVFFGKTWNELGTKESLRRLIAEITGIPPQRLRPNFEQHGHMSGRDNFCVAQKISWAAKRQTSRIEDMAYCLLGILGVSMPLVYGEGENSFVRLQLEILKVSTDQSLFAWRNPTSAGLWIDKGAFATSPAQFADCGNLELTFTREINVYDFTNKGLRISLPVREIERNEPIWVTEPSKQPNQQVSTSGRSEERLFLALLECQEPNDEPTQYQCGIYLRKSGSDRYYRTFCDRSVQEYCHEQYSLQTIYVHESPVPILNIPRSSGGFSFHKGRLELGGFVLRQATILNPRDIDSSDDVHWGYGAYLPQTVHRLLMVQRAQTTEINFGDGGGIAALFLEHLVTGDSFIAVLGDKQGHIMLQISPSKNNIRNQWGFRWLMHDLVQRADILLKEEVERFSNETTVSNQLSPVLAIMRDIILETAISNRQKLMLALVDAADALSKKATSILNRQSPMLVLTKGYLKNRAKSKRKSLKFYLINVADALLKETTWSTSVAGKIVSEDNIDSLRVVKALPSGDCTWQISLMVKRNDEFGKRSVFIKVAASPRSQVQKMTTAAQTARRKVAQILTQTTIFCVQPVYVPYIISRYFIILASYMLVFVQIRSPLFLRWLVDLTGQLSLYIMLEILGLQGIFSTSP